MFKMTVERWLLCGRQKRRGVPGREDVLGERKNVNKYPRTWGGRKGEVTQPRYMKYLILELM